MMPAPKIEDALELSCITIILKFRKVIFLERDPKIRITYLFEYRL